MNYQEQHFAQTSENHMNNNTKTTKVTCVVFSHPGFLNPAIVVVFVAVVAYALVPQG